MFVVKLRWLILGLAAAAFVLWLYFRKRRLRGK
jgi:hypothetical protein